MNLRLLFVIVTDILFRDVEYMKTSSSSESCPKCSIERNRMYSLVNKLLFFFCRINISMTDISLSTLPNELLYHILNYLDTCFIFFTLRRVSKQFYKITNQYNRYMLNVSSMGPWKLREISRILQPENIISIELDDISCKTSRVELFFSIFNIDQLVRLKSIILGKFLYSKDYEHLNKLPLTNIMSLHIDSRSKDETYALPFISKVLTQPTLVRVNLIKSGYTIKGISWPSSNNIQHLTIQLCSFSEYNHILQCLPFLQTMVMAKFIGNQSEASIQYRQLISLAIGQSALSMVDFESLLSLTPSLIRLKIRSYRTTLDSIANGSDWTDLIQRKLSNLKIFQFFFSYSLKQRSETKDLDLLIERFRTPFWLHEKQWIITCDYFLQDTIVNFYTTPRCAMDFEKRVKFIKKRKAPSTVLRFHSIVDVLSIERDGTELNTLSKLDLNSEHIEVHDIKYLVYALQMNKVISKLLHCT